MITLLLFLPFFFLALCPYHNYDLEHISWGTQQKHDFRMMTLEFHQMVQILLELLLKFLSMCPFKANKGALQDWFAKCLPMTFGQANGNDIRGSWVWQTWEIAKFSGIVNNIGKFRPLLMCKVEIFPFGFKKWKRLKNLVLNSCWDLENLLGLVEHLMALKTLYLHI